MALYVELHRELSNPVLMEDELSHLLLNVETPPGARLRAAVTILLQPEKYEDMRLKHEL